MGGKIVFIERRFAMASVSKNALIMQNRIKNFLCDIELVSFLCVLNTKTKVFEDNEEFKKILGKCKRKYKIMYEQIDFSNYSCEEW